MTLLPPKRMKLTDQAVEKLPLATVPTQYQVRDEDQPGFFLVVGRRVKTYTAQGDLRQRGKRRTLRIVIGRHPETSARAARTKARELLGQIGRGHDPSEPKRSADGPTLAEAWALYKEARLIRRQSSDRTMGNYAHIVEKVLAGWLDVSLAELGREPKRVRELHDKVTKGRGPYQANAAMRIFRAIYNHARKIAPELPPVNPATLLDWHPEKRRDTALGIEDLSTWHAQLRQLPNPVRREFHLFTLLSGSRPDALKKARWEHLDVKRRALHIPRPKGGAAKAFEIPLSREMLRCLWRVRNAGRRMYPRPAETWIFPADSRSEHIAAHAEDRLILSKWGNDLRQTYRTLGQAAGLSELDLHFLMNHSAPGVNAGYVTRARLVTTHFREQQEIMSRFIVSAVQRRPA